MSFSSGWAPPDVLLPIAVTSNREETSKIIPDAEIDAQASAISGELKELQPEDCAWSNPVWGLDTVQKQPEELNLADWVNGAAGLEVEEEKTEIQDLATGESYSYVPNYQVRDIVEQILKETEQFNKTSCDKQTNVNALQILRETSPGKRRRIHEPTGTAVKSPCSVEIAEIAVNTDPIQVWEAPFMVNGIPERDLVNVPQHIGRHSVYRIKPPRDWECSKPALSVALLTVYEVQNELRRLQTRIKSTQGRDTPCSEDLTVIQQLMERNRIMIEGYFHARAETCTLGNLRQSIRVQTETQYKHQLYYIPKEGPIYLIREEKK